MNVRIHFRILRASQMEACKQRLQRQFIRHTLETLPKASHSDNLILPNEATRLDLPELLVEITLV